jgi:hypothetical protein
VAKQRYIDTKFWDDKFTSSLDPIEKLLFLYLLTNPLTNIAGVYEIELRRISFDTGLDQEMVKKLLDRFGDAGKAYWEVGWIVIPNFIKHQSRNPKVNEGITLVLNALPGWLKVKLVDKSDPIHLDFDSLSIGYDRQSHSNTNYNLIKFNTNPNAPGARKTPGGDEKQTSLIEDIPS